MAKTKTTTKRQTKSTTKPKTKTKTKKQSTPDDEVKVCRRRSDRRTKAETKKGTAADVTKPKATATQKTTAKKTATKKTTAKKTATKKTATKAKAVETVVETVLETPETETLTPPKQEKRKVQRRRQIDPTTCERDYTDDEIEFMHALDEYKRANGRMFPTCSEILEVVRKLGYEKLDVNQTKVVAAPLASETDVLDAVALSTDALSTDALSTDALSLAGSVASETI